MMEYLIAFQALCGCFSAYVAGRRGRSRLVWWFIGALLPVAGVLLSLTIRAARGAGAQQRPTGGERRKRPRRCTGSFSPDCFGCAYFRRALFEADRPENKRGYCELFKRDLKAVSEGGAARLTVEDE